ncbi:reverse transcriptase domain-containing protein [Tanacetum coccineum]
MVTPVEKRSSNKFCDFHNDKGHSTDECMQLKKQIEELVRAGKLSHLIKEIKQGRDQTKNAKKETPAKDKSLAIYMIQPWQRIIKQKLTQSFARVSEITFPPLVSSDGTEGPLVIEAEIGGHMIHRISMSPYNDIIGRSGIREIQAVPSTAHGMLKFPVDGGIVTIRSTILIPAECATEVAIGGTLSAKGRTRLCTLMKKNLDIFAWQPSDMKGVPRSVAEHRLNIMEIGRIFTSSTEKKGPGPRSYESHPSRGTETSRGGDHERSLLPRLAIQSSHGYHQIQIAELDEEKTAFHTSQGVYCYTKMPFGLKNVGATYQRLVDKAFDSQVGRNIKVYVDDIVIESYTEAEMLRDMEETFRTNKTMFRKNGSCTTTSVPTDNQRGPEPQREIG